MSLSMLSILIKLAMFGPLPIKNFLSDYLNALLKNGLIEIADEDIRITETGQLMVEKLQESARCMLRTLRTQ